MGKARLILLAAPIALAGCAAVDGIKSKAADFSDLDAPLHDDRGDRVDGPNAGDVTPMEREAGARARLATPKEDKGPARPRPDGPTMHVVKTRACAVTLEAIAGDATVAPRTRSLAERVLRCDGPTDRYDIRHAPCSLFQSPGDDRAVDASIVELRDMAVSCRAPNG